MTFNMGVIDEEYKHILSNDAEDQKVPKISVTEAVKSSLSP